ncbi:MAG: glucose-6-phosphate isomerase [Saprospiraceae bacterium]|nr:glucose-6-phosphate isomerase [Saprospiraceae bacterium]
MRLSLDFKYSQKFIDEKTLVRLKNEAIEASKSLQAKTGKGNDFLGWMDLPSRMKAQTERIQSLANSIRLNSEVLIVIGIGGSYLGAKSGIHFLKHHFYNELSAEKRDGPAIFFAGTNMSPQYLKDLIDLIGDRSFSLNVISKSGTTTEPAIAFRFLKSELEKRYGKDLKDRIFLTTDPDRGALTGMAKNEGYEKLVIDPSVGGRFSVLSPVGLLPLAVAGVDINALLSGAEAAMKDVDNTYDENPMLQYAVVRNHLYQSGFKIEMMINYEPRLHFLAEWWKQLYGESEGKEHKGIFPASASYTTDLHSLGQYVQDGERHLFQTLLHVEESAAGMVIQGTADDLDKLNYLEGKTLDYVNKKAEEATLQAHYDGGVPNIIVKMEKADTYNLGYLFYFFEYACGVSAYMLDVNPFDQPGVETYKSNMFKLLGKPNV